MTVYYTSDLHLGHLAIAMTRGFTTAEEHDAALEDQWRAQVGKDSHVWVLGDVQMSSVEYALDFIKRMPGTKHLITGNHDPCHPMHRNAHKFQRKYLEAFESVQAFAKKRIEGQEVLLSHFPYNTDHTSAIRYTQYRLRDEGRWLLHGHTHGPERLHGHEIHVGLDAWEMQLVPHELICKIIREEISDDPTSPTRT